MSESAHRLVALLLVLLIGAAGYQVFKTVWLGRYRLYSNTLAQLESRLAHYQTLLAKQSAIAKELAKARKDNLASEYYLPQNAPPLAATALQQRVSQIVQASGGSLNSSQILPATKDHGFTRVAVRIQLTGDIETLQKTFYDLESKPPMLFINNVSVRSRVIRRRNPVRRGAGGRIIRPKKPYHTDIQLLTGFEVHGYMRKKGS